MNSITDFLDLEDSEILITDSVTVGMTKTLTIETKPYVCFCPCCGFRMHSRGIKVRTVSHPILQDGYHLVLKIKQRRWRCTNETCRYEKNEEFRFVNRRRRNTNAADFLIINEFRDLSASAVSIAEKFHTTDTHVLDTFDRYVKMDRLELTSIISIDEVCTDMGDDGRYALVIQDFFTGDPIDIVRSRRSSVTEPYFASIPKEERSRVKYLLTDMYEGYSTYVTKFFPNAVSVVDSFHVVQWAVRSIDGYIRSLERQYRQRDRELWLEKHGELPEGKEIPASRELYLLRNFKWLILANKSNIRYHADLRMDNHLHCMMNTYDYEDSLFRISPRLRKLRDLKELYVQFNLSDAGMPLKASDDLEKIIEVYMKSEDSIFIDFAGLLCNHREAIINSFIIVEKNGPGGIYESRLSNGPIESMNRKIKDLKRLGRGYRNFEHFRNRFLFAARSTPVLNGMVGSTQVQHFSNDNEI